MISFKELIEIFRQDSALNQALAASREMLSHTTVMFDSSVAHLRYRDMVDSSVDVFAMDKKVNEFEREVRRRIVKHLAITGAHNMVPGLILTSIVIDFERVGDYCKNIMDLAKLMDNNLKCGKWETDIGSIERSIKALFAETEPVMETEDEARAQALREEHWWVLKKCDEILESVVTSSDHGMTASDAAATAVYVRYLKRVCAHLLNIISSVDNPFDFIGFRFEDD